MSYTNFSRYKSKGFVLSHSRHEPIKEHIFDHTSNAEYEFIYFYEASSVYHIEDKEFPISKGSVIITPPGKIDNFTNNPNSINDRFHTRINPSLFSSDIVKHIPKDLFVINVDEDSMLVSLFKKIDYYCQNIDDESLLHPLLIHCVEEIVYNIVLHSKNQDAAANYSSNPIFSKVIAFIDKKIRENITVDMICRELFISKSYLHKLFLQRLAKTPKKYIMEKKLFLAQTDIRHGKLPTEVYSDYGFANYSTFYRCYKNLLHRTPSEDYKYCNSEKNK